MNLFKTNRIGPFIWKQHLVRKTQIKQVLILFLSARKCLHVFLVKSQNLTLLFRLQFWVCQICCFSDMRLFKRVSKTL